MPSSMSLLTDVQFLYLLAKFGKGIFSTSRLLVNFGQGMSSIPRTLVNYGRGIRSNSRLLYELITYGADHTGNRRILNFVDRYRGRRGIFSNSLYQREGGIANMVFRTVGNFRRFLRASSA